MLIYSVFKHHISPPNHVTVLDKVLYEESTSITAGNIEYSTIFED